MSTSESKIASFDVVNNSSLCKNAATCHIRELSHINMAKSTGKDIFLKECAAVHSPQI
jgi:hypothetical protein